MKQTKVCKFIIHDSRTFGFWVLVEFDFTQGLKYEKIKNVTFTTHNRRTYWFSSLVGEGGDDNLD